MLAILAILARVTRGRTSTGRRRCKRNQNRPDNHDEKGKGEKSDSIQFVHFLILAETRKSGNEERLAGK